MTRSWPSAVLVAAATCYAAWVLGPVLNPAIDPIATVASELAATDQPHSWFFRGADIVAGTLAVAAGGYLGLRSRGWAGLSWVGVVVFGIATVLDSGVTPMTCAASLNRGCAPSAGDLQQELADPHVWTSSLAVGASLVSLVLMASRFRCHAPGFAFAGYAIAAATAAASLVSTLQFLGDGDTEGAWQRAQLVGLSAWLVYAAVAARRKR